MDYKTYVNLQTVLSLSHEEEKYKWAEGQRIFVRKISRNLNSEDLILDCACGDGIGLEELRNLGFKAIGVDLASPKLDRAKKKNLDVFHADMHDLSMFDDNQFSAIICSHTLEHALHPDKVLENFKRILKLNGTLFVVLPFPDPGVENIDIHIAKDILGTSDEKEGEAKIEKFFNQNGFKIIESFFDNFREPEIWLILKQSNR